ncbi:MAG: type I restriction enzyme HsdR N-terminal domain-containing protein [Candidatus Methanoperedens sp.]
MAKKVKNPTIPIPSWNDRNKVLKVIKAKKPKGWLQLVIAQNKEDQKKSLRLRKHLNWFSIKSPKDLRLVQRLLIEGSKELGWNTNLEKEEVLTIVDSSQDDLDNDYTIDSENLPKEVVEFIQNNPKSVMKLISTLDLGELNDEDSKFLNDFVNILYNTILGSEKRLKVSFQRLLERITKEDYKGMDELSDLMDNLSLIQITSLTKQVKERLNSIEIFEEMIHNEKTYELKSDKSIHRMLERNMWLIDENYWILQSNKSLRTFIVTELEKIDKKFNKKRPDFVCVNNDNKLIIVEIKKPSLEIGKEEFDQIELYLRLIKKYKGNKYRSIDAYLIGNKLSDEARELMDLRRYLTVWTYQDLIESTRQKYQEFLKIVENSN